MNSSPENSESIFYIYKRLKLEKLFLPAFNLLSAIEAKYNNFESIKKWCAYEREGLRKKFYSFSIEQNYFDAKLPRISIQDSSIVAERTHEMHRFYMSDDLSNVLRNHAFEAAFSLPNFIRKVVILSENLDSPSGHHFTNLLNYMYWQGNIKISSFELSSASQPQGINTILNGFDLVFIDSFYVISATQNISKALLALNQKIPVILWIDPSLSGSDLQDLANNDRVQNIVSSLHLITSTQEQKEYCDKHFSPLSLFSISHPITSVNCFYNLSQFQSKNTSSIIIIDFTNCVDIDMEFISDIHKFNGTFRFLLIGIPVSKRSCLPKEFDFLDELSDYFLVYELAKATTYISVAGENVSHKNAIYAYLCGCKLFINQSSSISEVLGDLSGVQLCLGSVADTLPLILSTSIDLSPPTPSDMLYVHRIFGLESHLKSILSAINRIYSDSSYCETSLSLKKLYALGDSFKVCVILYLRNSEVLAELSRLLGSLKYHSVYAILVVEEKIVSTRLCSDIEYFIGQKVDEIEVVQSSLNPNSWPAFCEIISKLNSQKVAFDFLLNLDIDLLYQYGCFDYGSNNSQAVESLLGSPYDLAKLFTFLSQKEVDLVGPYQLPLLSDSRRQPICDSSEISSSSSKVADQKKLFSINRHKLPNFWINSNMFSSKIIPIILAGSLNDASVALSLKRIACDALIQKLCSLFLKSYHDTSEFFRACDSCCLSLKPFQGIHAGSDIYILCSGPSLQLVSDSFFEGKVTIGVNSVSRLRKVTYALFKEYMSVAVEDDVASRSLAIFAALYRSGNRYRGTVMKNGELFRSSNIVYFDHLENKLNDVDFGVVNPHSLKLVVSSSSVTSAIHLAWFMGAKNIILVGHDCGVINGKVNIDGYSSRSDGSIDAWGGNSNRYRKWLAGIESQTSSLRDHLKKYSDVNIYSLNPFVSLSLEGNTFYR